jgi:hypothetical protein
MIAQRDETTTVRCVLHKQLALRGRAKLEIQLYR